MSSRQRHAQTLAAFALLPLLLTRSVLAQDASATSSSTADPSETSAWPEWVTNDYDCVIGCLQGFNSSMTLIPNDDLEQQAYSCVGSTCDSTYSSGNYYQAYYIIHMFYATGSIYETSSSDPSTATGTDWSSDSSSAAATADPAATATTSDGDADVAVSGTAAAAETGTDGVGGGVASATATASGSVTGSASKSSSASTSTSTSASAKGKNSTSSGNSTSSANSLQVPFINVNQGDAKRLVELVVGLAGLGLGGMLAL